MNHILSNMHRTFIEKLYVLTKSNLQTISNIAKLYLLLYQQEKAGIQRGNLDPDNPRPVVLDISYIFVIA